jgi:hypothetical protein
MKCLSQDRYERAPPECESRVLLLCPPIRLHPVSLIKKCEVYWYSHKFRSFNLVLSYIRQCRLVVRVSGVHISVCRAAVLTGSSHGFLCLSSQTRRWCLTLGDDCFLLHPFQVIIHYLSYGLTLCI